MYKRFCLLFIIIISLGIAAFAQAKNYTSQTASVNGVKVHYLKAGTGKNVLVLMHGFAETSHMWTPVFEEFGKDYTIIAPDLPGIGGSSPAPGYDKKTAAANVHEMMKSLGYQKIYLVGHDIGLMVAYAYAAQYPDEVQKLALLEAPIPGIGDVWDGIYNNGELWHFHFVDSSMALDLVKGRERIFLEHFLGEMSANPKAVSEEEKQYYANEYAKPGAMAAAFGLFKAFNKQDAEDNRQFAKTKLPMPVLLITGDKSMNHNLEAQAKLVARDVRSVIFPNTGHWLLSERLNETEAELKKFFGDQK
jgi:pimeloyl-ACP methyl ester carboxylesterase